MQQASAGACSVYVTVTDPNDSRTTEIDIDVNGLWVARQPVQVSSNRQPGQRR